MIPSREGPEDENHIYMIVFILKKIFSRTSKPISIKLGTYHPWVKGILICLNEGPGPLQRGHDHKNSKMGRRHLKVFSRTTELEELIFT
jgi:hypothetical protein